MENIEDIHTDSVIQYKKEFEPYVLDLLAFDETMNWSIFSRKLMKKYKFSKIPKAVDVSCIYRTLLRHGKIERNKKLEEKIIAKKSMGMSGVTVVTIATKPDRFSCNYDCYYCPNEPNQPRSYLSDEFVLTHANKFEFDVVKQFYRRGHVLYHMEHGFDKLEVIIIGGTWSCYSESYQLEFIRDIYYSANIFYDMMDKKPVRDRMDLESEKQMNEISQCRIISLTLETRPDRITPAEIVKFRKYGATKIQIGVQHLDDEILRGVNRLCYYQDTVRAIKLLKDNGFKIDIHIMPNLPHSTPAKDIEMFRRIITEPDLQADQWKIYPCEVMPYTKIAEWYREGKYIPYHETELVNVIKYALENVPYHIRINRIIRDFIPQSVIAGIENFSMRSDIQMEMQKHGIQCKDIRVREVKDKNFDENDIEVVIRKYFASHGLEYFISHESKDRKTLYSLLRLRINDIHNECVFPRLKNCAFIREIHTYGKMICHGEKPSECASQHKGLGKQLMDIAEKISKNCGYTEICVISGVGCVNYYKKLGYEKTEGDYLIKTIN